MEQVLLWASIPVWEVSYGGQLCVRVCVCRSTEELWDKGFTLGIRLDMLVGELEMEGLQCKRNQPSPWTPSTPRKPRG